MLVYNQSRKEKILGDFYTSLLGSFTPTRWDFELLDLYSDMFSLDHLDAPFSDDEISHALWHMRVNSSPIPDGFSLGFFKSFWDVVKDGIRQMSSEFHAGTSDLACVNQYYIVLLPKKDGVTTTDGFRPILLQNSLEASK